MTPTRVESLRQRIEAEGKTTTVHDVQRELDLAHAERDLAIAEFFEALSGLAKAATRVVEDELELSANAPAQERKS